MLTAIPAGLPSCSSHSPVCSAARSSRPSSPTPATIACAQRIARAGPSKVAAAAQEALDLGKKLVASVDGEVVSRNLNGSRARDQRRDW
jgi:hypothetical protein